MKDTLGKKIEYDGFNSYDIANALMELCGFDRINGLYDYEGTEYSDLYYELEKELFLIGEMAKSTFNRDSTRTLWNILGMIGELGERTGNWHTEETYDYKKPFMKFPSHAEF